jgi:iron complex outermembrane receptor protein
MSFPRKREPSDLRGHAPSHRGAERARHLGFTLPIPLPAALLIGLLVVAGEACPQEAPAVPGSEPAARPAAGDTAGPKPAGDGAGSKSTGDGKTQPPLTIGKETVTGGRLSDTDERRHSTASKLVFGREELDRYGDTNLGDVLKRLPGVTISGTPGRGGDIRMRGLGRGYTQILVNGEPAPRGFSIDSLSPDQVERIEIFRAPVAENSARAIAGTINIVLREDQVKRDNEVRAGLGWERGALAPSATLQLNDRLDRLGYNVTLNAGFRRNGENQSTRETTAIDTTTGATTLEQLQRTAGLYSYEYAGVNGQLNWRLDGGDSLVLTPFFNHSRNDASGTSTLEQPIGTRPAPYATSQWTSAGESTNARMFGNWRLRFRDGGRLELRINPGMFRLDTSSDGVSHFADGSLAHVGHVTTAIRDTSFTTSGKYSKPLGAGHQLGAGWEIERSRREEKASNLQDGVDALAQYGDIEAKTGRVALYAQDEWDVTPLFAVYGGVRWETIRTASATAITDVHSRSGVVSPLFHAVWKFDPESKDQVRLAVTRTYRSPTLNNLTAIPQINTTYPAGEPNTPTTADSVGNPDLSPELALGVDAAIEHYFAAGGLLSASVFRRSIDDLIRNVTTLETVSWSSFPRWVSRPRNFGHALSQGIELEAKFRLDEIVTDAPKVSLRLNYSRYWSRVDGIPGPHNRLDQQPPWTANCGVDYRLASLPWTLGGNLNLTPAFIVTQAPGQEYLQSRKRVADVYAVWKVTAATQLRLAAANLLAADYATSSRELFDTTDQVARSTTKSYRFYSARVEVKF